MATVLENVTKFWSVEVKGTDAFIKFGKIGATGTTQLKVLCRKSASEGLQPVGDARVFARAELCNRR